MDKAKMIMGLLLIGFGVTFFLQNVGIFNISWDNLWPCFVLIPGIVFHLAFFLGGANKQLAGLLVPGGILVVIGLLFFFENSTGWSFSYATWPVYLFAVAIGLFELWLFGERDNGLLIPVFILAGLGSIFTINQIITFPIQQLWPVVLILVGFYLMFGKNNKQKV